MMNDTTTKYTNGNRREQADRMWQALLDQAMRRGFFGTAAIEVIVTDGIVKNIKRRVEQLEK